MATDLVEHMFRNGAEFHEMVMAVAKNKPITKPMTADCQTVKGKNEKADSTQGDPG